MSTLLTLASSGVQTAVLPTTTSAIHQTHSPNNKPADDDTTANIIFGVFAIILALIGILLAWLQIRHYRQRQHPRFDDERTHPLEPEIHLHVVETL